MNDQQEREAFEEKCARNARVQSRYDELMREGKHGHYETMFRVVREEVERARAALAAYEQAQAEPRKPLMEERAHIKAFKVIADHPEWTVLNSVPVGRELHPFAVAFARAIEAAHGIKEQQHE